jgi:hypothetical protein
MVFACSNGSGEPALKARLPHLISASGARRPRPVARAVAASSHQALAGGLNRQSGGSDETFSVTRG